jgi:hypothetical protein
MKGSNMKRMQKDPDLLEEYDFSKGIRGKYSKMYAEGVNMVAIDPDVAEIFPDHDSVNQALRSLAEIIKIQKKRLTYYSSRRGQAASLTSGVRK